MKWPWLVLVSMCACLLAMGCSKNTAPPGDGGVDADTDGGLDGSDDGGDDGGVDGGDVDGGQDGDGGGGDGAVVPAQTRLSITAGGGTAQSADHKVRLHIGAPQPYGAAAGQGKTVQMGPKATP